MAGASPPKAVPFHTRPVTNWKGRVEISAGGGDISTYRVQLPPLLPPSLFLPCPAPATPIMVETPHPLWQASRAARCVQVNVCGGKLVPKLLSFFTPPLPLLTSSQLQIQPPPPLSPLP